MFQSHSQFRCSCIRSAPHTNNPSRAHVPRPTSLCSAPQGEVRVPRQPAGRGTGLGHVLATSPHLGRTAMLDVSPHTHLPLALCIALESALALLFHQLDGRWARRPRKGLTTPRSPQVPPRLLPLTNPAYSHLKPPQACRQPTALLLNQIPLARSQLRGAPACLEPPLTCRNQGWVAKDKWLGKPRGLISGRLWHSRHGGDPARLKGSDQAFERKINLLLLFNLGP